MIEIVVSGAAGRMGGRILALARASEDLRVVAALEAPGHPSLGQDAGTLAGGGPLGIPLTADLLPALTQGRVLVEFTTPAATLAHARLAAPRGTRMVIGTTGLSAVEAAEIGRLAAQTAILLSPNMSVGVNVVLRALAMMARALGDDYDIEITEIHHRTKKDAPSGTALKMAEVAAGALGRRLGDVGTYGRHGLVGERPAREIGVHALRGGDVIGEHTVVFATQGERVELTHRAHSRDTFAWGALRAIRFVAGRPPGLYSIDDVLAV